MAPNPSREWPLPLAPSRPAPAREDAGHLARERHLLDMRIQAALVRSLLDEFDLVVPPACDHRGLHPQIIEEMTRLGRRILETAGEFIRENDDRTNDQETRRIA